MKVTGNPSLLKMVLPLAEEAQKMGLMDGVIDDKRLGNVRFFIDKSPKIVLVVFDENSFKDIVFPASLSGKKIYIGNN